MSISLGTKVLDPITGFTGTATARIERLGEAPRVGVESGTLGREGTPVEVWFPESRLTLVESPAVLPDPAPAEAVPEKAT
jgi:hypothetical protein